MTIQTNLQVALECAALGFRVMPLRWKEEILQDGQKRKPKSPKWSNYMDKATTDPRLIRRIWQKDPMLLVGILTEKFTVIDLDRHKDRDGFPGAAWRKDRGQAEAGTRQGDHRQAGRPPGGGEQLAEVDQDSDAPRG